MKFFLDTADLNEIEEAASWGALAGVTTNPSLYARVGGKLSDFHNHIKRICDIVDGPPLPPTSSSRFPPWSKAWPQPIRSPPRAFPSI